MIKQLILSLLFIYISLAYTCPSQCGYYFDRTGSGDYQPGCNSGSSTCTHCDNQYFYYDGSDCALTLTGIYNSTQSVSVHYNSWFQNDHASHPSPCGSNQMKIDNTQQQIYQRIGITANSTTIYGFRIRFIIQEASGLTDMDFDLYLNHEKININYCATTDFSYQMSMDKSWAYTSPFIPYHDQGLEIWIDEQNINGGGGSDYICIPDMILLLAECVQFCQSCRNLTTCTDCSTGKVLDMVSRLCYDECPNGTYYYSPNQTCLLCPYHTYSLRGVCYYECPEPFEENDYYHACIAHEYQLHLNVSVIYQDTLAFIIQFPYGLNNDSIDLLNSSSWRNYISISFYLGNDTNTDLITNYNASRRLLQTSFQLYLENRVLENGYINVTSKDVSPYLLFSTHQFTATFSRPMRSSTYEALYSLTGTTDNDDQPWFIREYFDYSLIPIFLIFIFLAAIALILIFVRVKYIYRLLIEYYQCIQFIGLTIYSIYPHSNNLILYSFIYGADFSNLSFMYNVPKNHISACYYNCMSFTSFAYVQGDMNWFRLMGALLLMLVVLLIIAIVLYLFKCSRSYSYFFIRVIADIILIKTIHSWAASFVFGAMNLAYNNTMDDQFFHYGMHFVGYVILIPLMYYFIKRQKENRYVNISFVCTIIFSILMVFVGLAPTLMCLMLLFLTGFEWLAIYFLDLNQQELPRSRVLEGQKQLQYETRETNDAEKQQANYNHDNDKNVLDIDEQEEYEQDDEYEQALEAERKKRERIESFHNHLLRIMKPITAFCVAIIVMVFNPIASIIVVSVIFLLLLILIGIVACLLHYLNKPKEQTVQSEQDPKETRKVAPKRAPPPKRRQPKSNEQSKLGRNRKSTIASSSNAHPSNTHPVNNQPKNAGKIKKSTTSNDQLSPQKKPQRYQGQDDYEYDDPHRRSQPISYPKRERPTRPNKSTSSNIVSHPSNNANNNANINNSPNVNNNVNANRNYSSNPNDSSNYQLNATEENLRYDNDAKNRGYNVGGYDMDDDAMDDDVLSTRFKNQNSPEKKVTRIQMDNLDS